MHIWSFSLPYSILPLVKLKGQIMVNVFSVSYLSKTKEAISATARDTMSPATAEDVTQHLQQSRPETAHLR